MRRRAVPYGTEWHRNVTQKGAKNLETRIAAVPIIAYASDDLAAGKFDMA